MHTRLPQLSAGKSLFLLTAFAGQIATNPAICANPTKVSADNTVFPGSSAASNNNDSTVPLKPAQPTSSTPAPAIVQSTVEQSQPFKDPFDQPDTDARHDVNKTLDVGKLRLHSAVHKYSFE